MAAEALAKNPANVIPTCIVAKNLLGSSRSFSSSNAFLFPSSASICSLFLLSDTIAISAEAKKALIKVRTNINSSCNVILPSGPESISKYPLGYVIFYI